MDRGLLARKITRKSEDKLENYWKNISPSAEEGGWTILKFSFLSPKLNKRCRVGGKGNTWQTIRVSGLDQRTVRASGSIRLLLLI